MTSPRIGEASPSGTKSASKNTRRPGAVLSSSSNAITPRPSSRTASELATPALEMSNIFVGADGLAASRASTVPACAFTTNRRSP